MRPPGDVVLLAVREPQEFASGHVPGACNLPQADLATRLGEVPRDRPIFVICRAGFDRCGLRSSWARWGSRTWRA